MEIDEPSAQIEAGVCVRCGAWARAGSRYCSDACGIAVHMERIAAEKAKELEEARLQCYKLRSAALWLEIEESMSKGQYTSCAEEADAKLLIECQVDRESERELVSDLKRRKEELEVEIATYQTKNLLPDDEEPEDHVVGRTSHFDCPYCGVVPSGNIVSLAQHLPACFFKLEQANQVTGDYATPEGDVTSLIYCDRFDPKTGKYCKKLKASCFAHSGVVTPKPLPGIRSRAAECREICGAPTKNASGASRCSLLRTKCPRHYNWENLARQQLELQLISHSQLAEALHQEVHAIKEKMILARMCRGLQGSAQTIPASHTH